MSEENVELVRNWMDAWVEWFNSERDPEALGEVGRQYMAPDVVYEEDPVWPDAGTFHGPDAVLRRFLEYLELMHLEGMARGEVIDAGGLVFAEVRIAMLGAEAGEPVDFLWSYTVRVDDGRVVHFRAWYDRDEAAKAAGLRE
jgi:ketosteroid isomerase-like protein